MKVFVWLPTKKNVLLGPHLKALLSKNSGHAAIKIAGRYFSFSTEEGGERKWVSTVSEDDEFHRKAKNKRFVVELDVDEALHPYILSIFSAAYQYPGLSGFRYGLRGNNCCTAVASFIQVAITAYLIDMFKDEGAPTFWKTQSRHASNLRLDAISKYYPQGEETSIFDRLCKFSNREAILQEWTLYHLYVMTLVDLYDRRVASETLSYKDSEGHAGGKVLWHPMRTLIYARFARSLLDANSYLSLTVPRVYRVGMDGFGAYERRAVSSAERLNLELPNTSRVRTSIDMAFLNPTGSG